MFSPNADRATNSLIEEDANVHLVMAFRERRIQINKVSWFKNAVGKSYQM